MDKIAARLKRKFRVRSRLKRLPVDRPRLSVSRSNRHIYAQIIDDAQGHTLAAASSLDEAFRKDNKIGADKEAASLIGKLVAERGLAAGVKTVRFDRGGNIYHGRIRALAEAAREAGLEF